jgi:hypothetical protein
MTPSQEASNATNQRYIVGTLDAIRNTFKRRHENRYVRKACRDNIAFYRRCKPSGGTK